MELRLVQTPRTELQQLTTFEMRLEARSSEASAVRDAMQKILGSSLVSPEHSLDHVLRTVTGSLQHDLIRRSLETLLEQQDLKAAMIKSPSRLATPTEATYREVTADALAELTDGKFEFERTDKEGKVTDTLSYEATRARVKQALLDRAAIEAELEGLQTLGDIADPKAAGQQIREMQMGLALGAELAEPMQKLSAIMKLAFEVTHGRDVKVMPDFFQELAVLNQLQFLMAERSLAQFGINAVKMSLKAKPGQQRMAFLNILVRFALASVGVATPSSFGFGNTLSGELEKRVSKESREQLKDLVKGFSLDIRTILYWPRWRLLGQPRAQVTDGVVRQTVADFADQKGEELLEVVNYPGVFADMREIRHQLHDKDLDRDGALDAFSALLKDTLTDPTFVGTLQDYFADSWGQQVLALGKPTAASRQEAQRKRDRLKSMLPPELADFL